MNAPKHLVRAGYHHRTVHTDSCHHGERGYPWDWADTVDWNEILESAQYFGYRECKRCSPFRNQRIAELTRQHLSAREISELLSIAPRTVTRARGRAGVAQQCIPSYVWTDESLATAGRLLDDGASFTEVGRTLGCSPEAVSKHFPGRGWTHQQSGSLGIFVARTNIRHGKAVL